VDYVNQGGRLILIGRVCEEGFDHNECTILKEALGIKQVNSDQPFASNHINVFNYQDVPVSFLESYAGEFDEVFATRANGEAVGFIKMMGMGKVIVFGAAIAVNTLDDLAIIHLMALKMDCPSPFILSNWADVHLSRGEKDSFLFINNYQDDPVETTIMYAGKILFGGNAIRLSARRGAILPLDWQIKPGVMIHYATSEIVEVSDDGSAIILKTDQNDFFAELTLVGYRCDQPIPLERVGDIQRVRLHGMYGHIHLASVPRS